ncbi:SGNH/GDSL hydrolase family protein [Paenibacillus sp. Soil724D2]|uniref:SGNH/GDSL hydrolase family protein n=1 Tax=Paenibacillus sp. (strain Soil724D2) TaxID=1736392 RepID=UPI0007155B4B|nr:SGNH/GDSL hydrolase family protein [Paenibacillus sp. Soil724D2]KRE33292.1 hypothetical protein ASG85_13510 [Paenibacillus sp. Soil724D2]
MWTKPIVGGGGSSLPNETTLLKFGESGGQPTYNGSPIASGSNPTAVDRTTENLYDKTRMVVGSSHNSSTGAVQASGNETHPIPCKPGYNYTFAKGDGIATQYSFYDASDVFISGGSNTKAKAPANAAFLRVYIASTAVSNVLMVMESLFFYADYVPYTQKEIALQPVQGLYRSKWYEKTWWVLGDSISTGWGDGLGTGNFYANKSYSYLLGRERRINVQNESVGGYTIGNVYDNKVVNMPPTANAPDLITIMAGTNDHGFNLAIGAITDDPASGTSFYARYRKTIEYLQARFPYTSIGLITPIQRNDTVNGNTANLAGFTLRQFCDAIVALGNYYSIPVLDWYTSLGFSPYIAAQKTNFYVSADGTHPNDYGHIKMAPKVGDFIEKL